jgi:hypothetical protein
MSVATENSAGATAIQPFTIPVTPGGGIETLRSRITATRWPGKKTDADQSHDVHLATKNELGFFRRRGRLPRALSGAAELGRAGPPQPHLLQRSRQGRPLRRLAGAGPRHDRGPAALRSLRQRKIVMSSTGETATEIRPFRVDLTEEILTEFCARCLEKAEGIHPEARARRPGRRQPNRLGRPGAGRLHLVRRPSSARPQPPRAGRPPRATRSATRSPRSAQSRCPVRPNQVTTIRLTSRGPVSLLYRRRLRMSGLGCD